MPSQKSMEKAREIITTVNGSPDLVALMVGTPCRIGALLAQGIAQALDDRTEECAKVSAAHREAWRVKRNLTEDGRERRDYESMSIAAAHVESSIRSLSKGSSHEG